MLTISLNGDALYQWDTDRSVTISSGIPEVHFSNNNVEALPVAVIDGIAEIPDVLLQEPLPITVWAYIYTNEGGYTCRKMQFPVIAKPRPLNYKYIETEVATAAMALKLIGDLEKLTTEEKSNLVAALNEIAKYGGGGVSDHAKLTNRDLSDQHPISAITGLAEALDKKQPKGDYLTAKTLPNASIETAGIVRLENDAVSGSTNAITSGAVCRLLGNSEQLVDEIYEIVGGIS